MKPSTEKTTRPARKDVPQLMSGTSHASRRKLCDLSLYDANATSVPQPTPVE